MINLFLSQVFSGQDKFFQGKTNTPHTGAADNQSFPLFGWSDGVFGEISSQATFWNAIFDPGWDVAYAECPILYAGKDAANAKRPILDAGCAAANLRRHILRRGISSTVQWGGCLFLGILQRVRGVGCHDRGI